MIIGVTLLSTLAASLAAVTVAASGGSWLAIFGTYLAMGWFVTFLLVAMAMARGCLVASRHCAQGDEAGDGPPYQAHTPFKDAPLCNTHAGSAGRLHA